MKKGKLLKILLILSLAALQLMLLGADFFSIGLRNTAADDRLVNIDKLIGGSGMPDAAKIPQAEREKNMQEDSRTEDTASADSRPEEAAGSAQVRKSTDLRIRVVGTVIEVNGYTVPESMFKSRLSNLYNETRQVILIDDYADYQTYMMVLKSLDEAGIKPKEERASQ